MKQFYVPAYPDTNSEYRTVDEAIRAAVRWSRKHKHEPVKVISRDTSNPPNLQRFIYVGNQLENYEREIQSLTAEERQVMRDGSW